MKTSKLQAFALATLLLSGAVTGTEAKLIKKKSKKAKTEKVMPPRLQSMMKPGPKPYNSIITPQAASTNGFLTVHKVNDKYYFEIPDSLLQKDVLIVNRISKAPASKNKSKIGYPGDILRSKVIRFEKNGENRIFVREMSYRERATDKEGMYTSVMNSNIHPIVATFNIESI